MWVERCIPQNKWDGKKMIRWWREVRFLRSGSTHAREERVILVNGYRSKERLKTWVRNEEAGKKNQHEKIGVSESGWNNARRAKWMIDWLSLNDGLESGKMSLLGIWLPFTTLKRWEKSRKTNNDFTVQVVYRRTKCPIQIKQWWSRVRQSKGFWTLIYLFGFSMRVSEPLRKRIIV